MHAIFNELQTMIDNVVLEVDILNQLINNDIIEKIEQKNYQINVCHIVVCFLNVLRSQCLNLLF